MILTCPEGHQTEATDYCDVCGTPMTGSGGMPSAGAPDAAMGPTGAVAGASGSVLDLPASAATASQTCPHCGALNLADALFCEDCGYDFTTGAAPLDDASPQEPTPTEPELAEPEPAESEPEPEPEPGPESTEPESEPAARQPAPEPEAEPAESEPAPPEPEPESTDPEPEQDVLAPEPEAAEAVPTLAPAAPEHGRPRHTPPSRDLADTWVVEVWIDPDWYAGQQTEEACPSAGVPDIVLVRRNVVLVGRPSGSRGVSPDVDAGSDSAVSRRHAQLTSDGQRWWVEDLGSSNGTFVGSVGEPLPTTPLTPGQRVEVDRDDRIYIGAWTRLVLRQATAAERADQG